jgi:hypothetical protein
MAPRPAPVSQSEITATANEIASVTGHKSLAEVTRYTRAADRAGLVNSSAKCNTVDG